jgi:hypothetical protein
MHVPEFSQGNASHSSMSVSQNAPVRPNGQLQEKPGAAASECGMSERIHGRARTTTDGSAVTGTQHRTHQFVDRPVSTQTNNLICSPVAHV